MPADVGAGLALLDPELRLPDHDVGADQVLHHVEDGVARGQLREPIVERVRVGEEAVAPLLRRLLRRLDLRTHRRCLLLRYRREW